MSKLKELMENEIQLKMPVMVGNISQKEDKTGAPYLMVDLIDGESVITARIFKTDKANCGFTTGTILDASIASSKYNGSMGYIVNRYTLAPADKYDKADFLITAPKKFDVLWAEYEDLLSQITDEKLKAVVNNLFERFKDRLVYWGAAKTMHHNYYGGLLYHSVCVAKNALALANNYDYINKEMVIAGGLLHDIGKLIELDTDELGISSYTVDGELFGHLFIGAELAKAEAKKVQLSGELTRQLVHIIVAHHDNPEWGAIKSPATVEARVVSSADFVDSQLEIMHQINAETTNGAVSERKIGSVRVYNTEHNN